jgi:integrase
LSGIKLHDLRHFYASGLIAAGCDVVTVQRSLGHAKATTTLNTCAHLWPTAEDRTRKAAESIMSASLGHHEVPKLVDDLSRRHRS